MKQSFNFEAIAHARDRLNRHPVYKAVRTLEDLRIFMSHHVYSVWDFMSVVKFLQQQVAPSSFPWIPRATPAVRYFINQLVLEEESDLGVPDAAGNPTYASHFELYCGAMREIGADPAPVMQFVAKAAGFGIESALGLGLAPQASSEFVQSTFGFLEGGKPHHVAAAFALGREHIIPEMFRAFLRQIGVREQDAPTFHYYLKRHIHLDEDFHAPISLMLLEELCERDRGKLLEAEQAAVAAIEARIRFWDGVQRAIERHGS